MTRKFDPKIYQGKNRIYRPVPAAQGILRLWVWDQEAKEYVAPQQGHLFDARRYEMTPSGGKKRVKRYFPSLEAARAWQHHLESSTLEEDEAHQALRWPDVSRGGASGGRLEDIEHNSGPTFGEIYEAFYRKKLVYLARGTQINYRRYIRLYFQTVLGMPIRAITAQVVDHWIEGLKETIGRNQQSRRRVNFTHELSVMRSVLKFYGDYYDDPQFVFPIKARHVEDTRVTKASPKLKDLSELDFFKFREELEKLKNGEVLSAMATLQFYQALRISEAAGVYFEDLNLDFRNPEKSTVRICRHVDWPRDRNHRPEVVEGFKNAQGGARSVKELYLFPEAFDALARVFRVGAKGLVFSSLPGSQVILTYRQIQKAFDTAFEKANLQYRGTHVLRHGGCRRVYNETGGDLALAQQLLGNSDLESTLVYAQRDKGALKEHVKKSWATRAQVCGLVANGRNGS